MDRQGNHIHWNNGQPYSNTFNDIYFSQESGLNEAEYVFYQHNNLQQRWKNQSQFTVGELGFGFGLNFLMTAWNWQQEHHHLNERKYLDYVAIEKYPPSHDQIKDALQAWPFLAPMTERLLQDYPPPIDGVIRLHWPEYRIRLTLFIGDIAWALSNLVAQVDAWYFDGFSPAKNPAMWSESVFNRVAHRSHANTSFATFTAAGQVKRNLMAAGFAVYKGAGFGKKRHMLYGTLAQPQPQQALAPYFARPATPPIQKVAVIGAGIAGCSLTLALTQRGFQVHLFDKASTVCAQASGVSHAMIKPVTHRQPSPYSRFHNSGYLFSCHQIDNLSSKTPLLLQEQRDTLALISSDEQYQKVQDYLDQQQPPTSWAQLINRDQTNAVANLPLNQPALHLPHTRVIHPHALATSMLAQAANNLTLHLNTHITHINYDSPQPTLTDLSGQSTAVDYIIVANADPTPLLPEFSLLGLRQQAGQISILPSHPQRNPHCIISFGGYALPTPDHLLIGSTYRDPDIPATVLEQDNLTNIQACLKACGTALDWIETTPCSHAFAAVRSTVDDHLPHIGPLMPQEQFMQQFARLQHGDFQFPYPNANYCPLAYCLGFGSKGLSGALIGAEQIASLLDNTPLPLSAQSTEATHPHRMWVKHLKKKNVKMR